MVTVPASLSSFSGVQAWRYNVQTWHHPGGKLRELGAQALTDTELLAILISLGIKGKPAETIAQEVIDRFGSLSGMARQPLEAFLQFKGLSDVKIIRIAAAFEIARRMVKEAARGEEK
jgi:DNA repair protein RadC